LVADQSSAKIEVRSTAPELMKKGFVRAAGCFSSYFCLNTILPT